MNFYIFLIILLGAALYCAVRISVIDLQRRIIPDVYLFPLMLIGILLGVFFPSVLDIKAGAIGATFGYVLAATMGVVFDWGLRKSGRKADTPIGMGDIKLIGVGGLWLGIYGLAMALVVACLTGGLWAHVQRQKYIPFAPFFVFGGFLSFIIGLFLL